MEKETKIADKYQSLWETDSRYIVCTGGRGSGKSFAVSLFLLTLTFEKNQKVLFTRYTLTSASTSIIPEFIDKIDRMGYNDMFRITKDSIINLNTKSEIIFKGIRTSSGSQTAALKSLSGVSVFCLDEAEELIDEATFDKIDFSVRSNDVQNRVILIMNPTTKSHWIYQRWFEPYGVPDGWNGKKNDATYIHTTWEDNRENLSQSFKDQLSIMKRDRPDKYIHQILGGWISKQEGVIIRNWRVGDFKETELMCFGQDFGFSNDPTTLVHVAVDTETKKMWVKECYGEVNMTTSHIGRRNREHAGNDLIICDNSEPRLIQELKSEPYLLNIKGTIKRKGSILSTISLLQDYEIIVDKMSHQIMKEFNNYVWKEKNSTPIDMHNHFCDAIRYSLDYLVRGRSAGVYVIR